MNTKEIKEIFENTNIEDLDFLFDRFEDDERSSVKKILEQFKKKKENYLKELNRLEDMIKYEKDLYDLGYEFICGIDEVGRGPLAGPVVSACVIMPKGLKIDGVNDSKKLSPKLRESLYEKITNEAIAYSIGIINPEEIDEINILNATKKSMIEALNDLEVRPDYLLIDAVRLNGVNINQTNIIKGDEKSHSIACASIVAKVERDRMMELYDAIYEGYDFASNKGYGSQSHIEAIKKMGLTPIHRKTFTKKFVDEEI